MEKPNTSAELMTLDQRFPIINPLEHQEVLELGKSNLGPRGIDINQLDRIQVPSGGAMTFEIHGTEGSETARFVTGVVGAWRDARMYYKSAYGEGQKKPPDCKSLDGVMGTGDPGGECETCPFAQFGSDKTGRGQACKQIRQILFVREGQIVPDLISVPPTSLKNVRQYFLRLMSSRTPYWGIVTNISLEPAQNAGGTRYARMVFSSGPRFSPEQRALMKPLADQMAGLLRPLDIDSQDYTVSDSDETQPF